MDCLDKTYNFTNFVGFLIIIAFLIHFRLKKCYQYWENRKVPYIKPKSLIFGSNLDLIKHRISFQEYQANLYNDLAPHRFGGYYNFQRPFLLIRDPEIIKHVLSLDFQKFRIRHNDADRSEPLRLNLFNLHGEEWKILREKLSPAFSPSKTRLMVELMKECAQVLIDVLEKPAENNMDIFISDIVNRYGTDVIGTCAFGFRPNTLINPDANFRKMIQRIVQPHFNFKLRSLMLAISPKLCKIFKVRMLDKEAVNYFVNLIDETIKYREKYQVVRNDFIDLLITLKREEIAANEKDKNRTKKIDISVENLAAQCFAFCFAGYATRSLISSALLELARNPEIQDKLRQEIDKTFETNNGQLSYDAINKMKYMDKVFSETIRCYPGQPVLLRQCVEDFQIPDSDIIIEKGTTVFIPRYGLNHDLKYFQNPNKFDPEHFTEEAKANRHPYTHLLFGDGPRKCVGMRFGQMHVKLALATLLRRYEFTLSPKMKFPLKYTSDIISTIIAGGVWLRCSKRN